MNSPDHDHDHDHENHRLCDEDVAALDALVEARFDLARVPETLRVRASCVARVLGLACESAVDANPAHNSTATVPTLGRQSLADRVMGLIANDRLTSTGSEHTPAMGTNTLEYTLSKDDAAAFADFSDAEYDAGQTAAKHRTRAQVHGRLAALVTQAPPFELGSKGLVERTFDLVMLSADAETRTFKFDAPGVGHALRTRMWDAVGVAAMLLLSASVLWPMMDSVKQHQQRNSCDANLGSVASAMANYAGANRDSLPIASAGYGGSWWDVGTPGRSNSANLYTLARTGYAKLRDLACPGNVSACLEAPSPGATDWADIKQVSYSYQIMGGPSRPQWQAPARSVILGDRSPVVLRALRREYVSPMENSPNHRQCGQDVLFVDGSSQWLKTPEVVAGGDNIWLPWQIEEVLRQVSRGERIRLEGVEMPGKNDAFLAP